MKILGSTSDNLSIVPKNQVKLRINAPIYLTANYTMSDSDSGNTFVYNGGSGSTITITFPSTLSDGFTCRVENAGKGGVTFSAPGYGAHFGNAQRTGLIFQWDLADIEIYTAVGTKIFMTTYNLGLPVLFAENSSAVATDGSIGQKTIPELALTLEANASYLIDLRVSGTDTVLASPFRLGMNGGSTAQGYNFNATAYGATAGASIIMMPVWADVANGVQSGNIPVNTVGSASITGKVRTAAVAITLTPYIRVTTSTAIFTIPTQGASFTATKVDDRGRA